MKTLTLVAFIVVILAAFDVSASLKCFRVSKPTTQTPTTTVEVTTSTTVLPTTTTQGTTTSRIFTGCSQQKVIGSKLACLRATGQTADGANTWCKSNNVGAGGRLYWVETAAEKDEILFWITSDVWNNVTVNDGRVYRINGFESPTTADLWFSDTNQTLIPEMIPPSTPTTQKCLSFSGDTGTWTPIREDCTSDRAFICEYQL